MPVMTKSPAGDDIVILSRKEYDGLILTAQEDASDVRVARDALARQEETLTNSELDDLLAAKSPLSFWRKRRSLTQAQLAHSAKIAQGFLSEIESGRKTGDIKTLKRLAKILHISLLDLIDETELGQTQAAAKKTAGKKR